VCKIVIPLALVHLAQGDVTGAEIELADAEHHAEQS
jgi:hypothetical protein